MARKSMYWKNKMQRKSSKGVADLVDRLQQEADNQVKKKELLINNKIGASIDNEEN